MNTLKNEIAKHIFTRLFPLRQSKVPKLKWREKIASEWVSKHHGHGEKFSEVWEYLTKEGLI
jgi:hypothetical protein